MAKLRERGLSVPRPVTSVTARSAYYVDEEAALDAFQRQGQFNVIVLESDWKADLMLRKKRAFSRSEFERRELATIDETQVFVATAEDTIVAKLEWARAGGPRDNFGM